jgi:hypothetical protein
MNAAQSDNVLVDRAIEALKAVLGAISSVKLTELTCESYGRGRTAAILARIDVLGRKHALTCEVNVNGNPSQLNLASSSLQCDDTHFQAQSTRVFIAPYLSPEAQALCKETNISFIDFEGNARIALGEIFISKRMMRPLLRDRVEIDPVILQEVKSRPSAPTVYIASTIPGTPVRAREGAPAGIAAA